MVDNIGGEGFCVLSRGVVRRLAAVCPGVVQFPPYVMGLCRAQLTQDSRYSISKLLA